jgi:HD-like signal output (HDOD) protein
MELVAQGEQLPPTVTLLGRLQQLLKDDRSNLQEVTDIVSSDPGLVLQIIRISNSVMYGGRFRCESFEEAAFRVGFNQIYQLVAMVIARDSFQTDLKLYRVSAGQVWENALAVALLMREMSARLGGNPDAAYVAGLLRNVGKVVLDRCVARHGLQYQPPLSLRGWEQDHLGRTSTGVTAYLLERWNFPVETINTISGCHAPRTEGSRRLHLACLIADSWGHGMPGEAWSRNVAANVDPAALTEITEQAHRQFLKVSRAGLLLEKVG